MDKELLQFITAIAVRRIAQMKIRSMFSLPDEKDKADASIYTIAGELCQDFKDVFLQETKELAETHASDKNLSPIKIALMLAEAIPVNASYTDVKDNFPETEDIKRKVISIKTGHPADLSDSFFTFGSDDADYNPYTPVDERQLIKPLDSDLSDIYEIVFNKAKALTNRLNPINFAEIIGEIAVLLMPIPLEISKDNFQSLGSYFRAVMMIGCSIFNEIKHHGPGVLQSDKSNLWVLTKIEVSANNHQKGKFVEASKSYKALEKEIIDSLFSDELMIPFHLIRSTQRNHLYLLHSKTFTEELDRKLTPVLAHWQAQNRVVVGIAHIEMNTNDLSETSKLSKCFVNADVCAHKDVIKKIATSLLISHVEEQKGKINVPELVKQSAEKKKAIVNGILLIKQELNPELLIDRNAGLVKILFANERFNYFWNEIATDSVKKHKMKLSIVHHENGELILKNRMVRLLSFCREFFRLYSEFGLRVNISASITTVPEGGDDGAILMAFQGFKDAKNMHRPKIRSDKEAENPFSGFKGSALSLGMIENKSRSIIPSEDFKIFFEMLRQIASLAGYRVNHDDVIPLLNETKPEIFDFLHSITNKMKTERGFNWRPVLYYILSDKLAEESDSGMKNHNEQAVINLLTTLRYNRWQNIQRLLSRPAYVYLNILAKWLRVLELN